MQQGCPQPHEEVPSALETLLLESASYLRNLQPLSTGNMETEDAFETLVLTYLLYKMAPYSTFLMTVIFNYSFEKLKHHKLI
jgi:hypothetical protein